MTPPRSPRHRDEPRVPLAANSRSAAPASGRISLTPDLASDAAPSPGLGAVSAGHGYHERGQDHHASERREHGDYGSHASIAGVIWEKAP